MLRASGGIGELNFGVEESGSCLPLCGTASSILTCGWLVVSPGTFFPTDGTPGGPVWCI